MNETGASNPLVGVEHFTESDVYGLQRWTRNPVGIGIKYNCRVKAAEVRDAVFVSDAGVKVRKVIDSEHQDDHTEEGSHSIRLRVEPGLNDDRGCLEVELG